MPTVGASLYEWEDSAWREVYANPMTREEFVEIQKAFDTAFTQSSFPRPEAKWGEQIEYRDTQVTFSAFGQTAPVEVKQAWDPSNTKKQELIRLLGPLLPAYAVKAGGMTSIDVTHAGIDKQYGIERFMEHAGLSKEDVLFVGDALYEGGNDHVVTKTGVDVYQVANPDDTLKQLSHFAVV
jgi:HAD superfamily hydrolase (TIGR01484 family)